MKQLMNLLKINVIIAKIFSFIKHSSSKYVQIKSTTRDTRARMHTRAVRSAKEISSGLSSATFAPLMKMKG